MIDKISLFFGNLLEKFTMLFRGANNDPDTKIFRTIIYSFIGMIFLIGISAFICFMIMIKGAEITMVPDVKGMQLEEALISIQDKGLNGKIQLKYSLNPGDKGTILKQQPNPGSMLRAGNNVILSVSRGAVIDKMEDYTGWDIWELKTHLTSLFSTYGTLLKIKEPVITIYDKAEAGTIIEQKPLPGTPITSFTEIELVVSQGPEEIIFEVPFFVTLQFEEALKKAASFNLPFTFRCREAKENEKKGVVISQTPEEKTKAVWGTMIQMLMTSPEKEAGKVFGILERTLPDYPVSINLKYETVSPSGTKKEVFQMKHKGGVISIPYLEEEGTTLIISVGDEELVRYTVKK